MKLRGPNGVKVKYQDGADFSGFEIDTWLAEKSIRGASFRGAHLKDGALHKLSVFPGSFVQCDFSGATIEIFQGQAARLISFSGCNFEGATVKGVEFAWCDFREASFRGADLTGTKFTHCNFCYTDFTDALISEQQFRYPYDDPSFSVFERATEVEQSLRGPQRQTFVGISIPLNGFSD